jgi:hypothetical protein
MQTRIAHSFSPDLSMERTKRTSARECYGVGAMFLDWSNPFAVVCRSRCFVFQWKPYMTKRNHFAHWSIANQFYSTLWQIVSRSLEHRRWVTDPYTEESIRRTSLGSGGEGETVGNWVLRMWVGIYMYMLPHSVVNTLSPFHPHSQLLTEAFESFERWMK